MKKACSYLVVAALVSGCVGTRSPSIPSAELAQRALIAIEEMEAKEMPDRFLSGHGLPMTTTRMSDTRFRIGIWVVDVRKRTYEGSLFLVASKDYVGFMTETWTGTFKAGPDGKWHASKPVTRLSPAK